MQRALPPLAQSRHITNNRLVQRRQRSARRYDLRCRRTRDERRHGEGGASVRVPDTGTSITARAGQEEEQDMRTSERVCAKYSNIPARRARRRNGGGEVGMKCKIYPEFSKSAPDTQQIFTYNSPRPVQTLLHICRNARGLPLEECSSLSKSACTTKIMSRSVRWLPLQYQVGDIVMCPTP